MNQTEKNLPLEEVLIQCCHWWLSFHIVSSDSIILILTHCDFFVMHLSFFMLCHVNSQAWTRTHFWMLTGEAAWASGQLWAVASVCNTRCSWVHGSQKNLFSMLKKTLIFNVECCEQKTFPNLLNTMHFVLFCFHMHQHNSVFKWKAKNEEKNILAFLFAAFLQQTSNLKSKLNEICNWWSTMGSTWARASNADRPFCISIWMMAVIAVKRFFFCHCDALGSSNHILWTCHWQFHVEQVPWWWLCILRWLWLRRLLPAIASINARAALCRLMLVSKKWDKVRDDL